MNCFAAGNISVSDVPEACDYTKNNIYTDINNSYCYEDSKIFIEDNILERPLNILVCSEEELSTPIFFMEKLGWSMDIWDFEDLNFENGKYPKLKKY